MESNVALQAATVATLAPMSLKKAAMPGSLSSEFSSLSLKQRVNEKASRGPKVVCAVAEGAIAIALVGTALPILPHTSITDGSSKWRATFNNSRDFSSIHAKDDSSIPYNSQS